MHRINSICDRDRDLHTCPTGLLSCALLAAEDGDASRLAQVWRSVIGTRKHENEQELRQMVDSHGGAGLEGVKSCVDDLVVSRNAYMGVTLEPAERWWYAQMPSP